MKEFDVKCRACQGKRVQWLFFSQNVHGRHLLGREQFGIYECADCKIVFTDVTADKDYYEKYYFKSYYSDAYSRGLFGKLLLMLKNIVFRRRLKLIKKYQPQAKNILEIGCGQGEFLRYLPAKFNKYGVEINKSACDYIKKHDNGIVLYNDNIDDKFQNRGEKYDVILMWHVFEHVANPENFIKNISNFLAKDGVIILEIPNRESIGFNLTKSDWFHLDTPRHLFIYSRICLERFTEKYGLKIIGYRGEPVDYFQDLAASFYAKFKTNNHILNCSLFIFVLPIAAILRLLVSLLMFKKAEVNTYVLKQYNV
ncbi:MAG: class I SAM-dependent methyltransferase [Candidatus Omnitrophota bacterium]